MLKLFKLAIIPITGFILVSLCAYAGAESGLAAGETSCSFSEWVNTWVAGELVDENSENELIREQWARNLGIDIFYLYFKEKEVERKLKEKISIKVFKMKGNFEFKSNEAKYTFVTKF